MKDDLDDDEEDRDFGSCENCGCNLLDHSEEFDGLCDQCSWWLCECDDDEM